MKNEPACAAPVAHIAWAGALLQADHTTEEQLRTHPVPAACSSCCIFAKQSLVLAFMN